MLAYYLHTLSPFIFKLGDNFGVRWYGFAYVMAFICGYWLYTWLAKRGYSEMPPENVGDFITWGALFGVMLGGRLGYVLFYKFKEYMASPLDIFKLWDGGMASHGGMLGLILFTLYYARRHKYSWTGIGDNLCVVAPIGLFFGRVANFINGELYGHPSTVPWAVQFPKELLDDGNLQTLASVRLGMPVEEILDRVRNDPHVQEVLRAILTPRHPSQIYEALLEGVVLFCALWFLRTKVRCPRGVLTGAFFIIYALVRIIGENFRVPDAPLTGFLTRGQFLSALLPYCHRSGVCRLRDRHEALRARGPGENERWEKLMRPVDEIQRVNDRLVFWQGYDPAVKVDLSSHSYLTAEGWVLIDPIPLRDEVFAEWTEGGKIAAIVLTNANHERAATEYQKKTEARIFAHSAAQGAFSFEAGEWISDGQGVCGLTAIHLPGFVAGEIALHAPEAGGVLLIGDALVNLQSTGFALLPDKYCDEPKLARKSAQKLLQFPFELMTFAHGLPITAGAKRRLEQLLQ